MSIYSWGDGLKKKSKAKPLLGYSDTETVKLDFDDASFRKVKYWAFRTMRRFRLQVSLFQIKHEPLSCCL